MATDEDELARARSRRTSTKPNTIVPAPRWQLAMTAVCRLSGATNGAARRIGTRALAGRVTRPGRPSRRAKTNSQLMAAVVVGRQRSNWAGSRSGTPPVRAEQCCWRPIFARSSHPVSERRASYATLTRRRRGRRARRARRIAQGAAAERRDNYLAALLAPPLDGHSPTARSRRRPLIRAVRLARQGARSPARPPRDGGATSTAASDDDGQSPPRPRSIRCTSD
jgi:hypothetical protein